MANAATYTVRDENGRMVPGAAWLMERFRQRLPATLKEMSISLLALIQRGMEQERSPDGTPWQQLKPSTVRQRGSAHPMLRRAGDLFRSLQPGTTDDSAYVGSNWPYAGAHQFGARIKRKGGTATLYFRQGAGGRVGNRFVRRNRSNFAQEAQVGPYEILIPARPYMFTATGRFPESWKDRMCAIVARRIGEGS